MREKIETIAIVAAAIIPLWIYLQSSSNDKLNRIHERIDKVEADMDSLSVAGIREGEMNKLVRQMERLEDKVDSLIMRLMADANIK